MSSQLRVHHLNCAHITTMKLGGAHLACHVLVVETRASGLVLVDTGLGSADYAAISSRLGWTLAHVYGRPTIDPALAAVEQIRTLGLDPADVRHIVQTHLDLDHVGGLSDFPWATVHAHASEQQAAMTRKGYRPADATGQACGPTNPDSKPTGSRASPGMGSRPSASWKGFRLRSCLSPCPATRWATVASPWTPTPAGCSTPATPASIPGRCTSLTVNAPSESACFKRS